MNIRGLLKFSLVDYPGKVSCIVFVGNCNFRCPYCHNPCLVFDPESQPRITEEDVFKFLETRKGKLDGIVVSGGEPSLRPGLIDFVKKVKNMGFLVKLDTNGSIPEVVKRLDQNGWLDYLGVDYKASATKYSDITACVTQDIASKVQETLKYAVTRRIPIDVRTTVHKKLLSADELQVMRDELDEIGIGDWTLQQFNPVEIIDDDLLKEPTYSDRELTTIARNLGDNTRVRGLKGIFIDS